MNLFSKILAALALGAETVLPIVIHSSQGILLLNAGEQLTLEIAQLFAPPQAAPAAAPVAAQSVTAVAVAVAEPQAVPQGAIHAVNLSALKPS